MKIIISPAKTLDFESPLPTKRHTEAAFLDISEKVNHKLAKVSRKKLAELMHISANLADLNYHRNQEFEREHTVENSRPAIFTFAGDVYVGLDAFSLPLEKLDGLQEKLRILSGLYGILKPLDLIQPYRLEMGTNFSVGKRANLVELWKDKITPFLNEEMEEGEVLVNLASNEYFKAIDTKKLKAPIVTPVFKDYKNGQLKIISFFAKKARGAMARFIVENDVNLIEDLRAFDTDGYRYSEKESGKENELVFTR